MPTPTTQLLALLGTLNLRLNSGQIDQLVWLARELVVWNRRVNLTAITDWAEIYEKHLADSLTLLPWLESAERLLDIGSGAGFPALPLKIARPCLEIVSLDAVAKKIHFQRHAARNLGLSGYTARHGRAEILAGEAEMSGRFDVVVARALTSLTDFVDLALPFLGDQGRIIAMKGAEGEVELAAAEQNLTARRLVVSDLVRLRLPVSGAERVLIILCREKE